MDKTNMDASSYIGYSTEKSFSEKHWRWDLFCIPHDSHETIPLPGREYTVYAWRDENSVYVADENEKLIYGNVYFESPDRAIKFFVDLDTSCGKFFVDLDTICGKFL